MIKEKWIEKYRSSTEMVNKPADVLTGFNANIDVIHQVSELNLDLKDSEQKLIKSLNNTEDLKSSLKYCINKSENNEVDKGNIELKLEGDEYIGGQAGIISNFLAKTGKGVIFYTPLLSEELASNIEDKVLYPVIDGEFMLKNVRDASNTDRLKKNHIFEFNNQGDTGRLIVSDTLKGFGPYFRKGVEDNLDFIQQTVDCAVLSGFHDIEGNKVAKLKKAARQVNMIDKPTHLEFVNKNLETTSLILEHLIGEFDSLGLDESEFKAIVKHLDIDSISGDLNLGEAFSCSKKLLNRFNLDRIHLHTIRYHIIVVKQDYATPMEKLRKSMLYGEVAAIQAADKGELPSKEDIETFNMENKEINGLQELEHFEDYFNLEDFKESGMAEIDDFKLVAIPTIIHRDPEKTVGMGDIISSGTFSSEFS